MQEIIFDLWLGKAMSGKQIRDLVQQLAAANFFVEHYQVTNKGVGDVIGFKFPGFGDSLVVAVKPGDALAIYDTEMYLDAKVTTYIPENGNRKDYLKILNNPDSDMINSCKNIRDTIQRALESFSSV